MKPITGLALFYIAFIGGLSFCLSIALNETYGIPAAGGFLAVWVFVVSFGRNPRHLITMFLVAAGAAVTGTVGLIFAAGIGAALLLLVIVSELCYEDDYETNQISQGQAKHPASLTPVKAHIQKRIQ